ncbi:MAG: ABC transporter permease [Chloroflexi bacterium]|nr:ABC transporter permease [Chloroflexota bacterium]
MATNVARLEIDQEDRRVGQSLTQLALQRLRRDKMTLIALAVVAIMILLAFVGAPTISNALGVNPTLTNASRTFVAPFQPNSYPNILGTDDLGRDHLARLLYAGQVSLSVGVLAATLSLTIGVTIGIITGFYGGVVDDIINWIIATLNSIPSLFLLLIVAAVLRPSPQTLVLILGFLGWTGITRLVRGETLSLREREYIVSARAVGASPLRIMFSHILPNLFSVIVIALALDIGGVILVEAALSFLGLGILPPTPSWGNMLSNSREFFVKGAHLVFAPGLMIFVTVLCMYIIGDGLRDAFDPTAKN